MAFRASLERHFKVKFFYSMPELPEIETVVRKLRPKILGAICGHCEIIDNKLNKPDIKLDTHRISAVERLGKQIHITFTHSDISQKRHLLIHFRMTGRLLLNSLKNHQNKSISSNHIQDSEAYFQNKIIRIKSKEYLKYVRAIFYLEDTLLYFFDTRRFGTFSWYSEEPRLAESVYDPIRDTINVAVLESLLSRCSKSSIKSFLLRQDKIVGIGNIYASEILFDAKIHPLRLCQSLTKKEIRALTKSIPKILHAAISHNGTTFSDFQHDDAETGSHQDYIMTYNRENLACKICGELIVKIVQQQRSTYCCGHCQK